MIIFSLGAEDASRLLSSTSTTVIKTEAKAAAEVHVEGAAVALPQVTETTRTTSSTSSSEHATGAAAATAKH